MARWRGPQPATCSRIVAVDPRRSWASRSIRRSGIGRLRALSRITAATVSVTRRSARAGSSLAGGLAELADDVRRRAHDDALAAAERAGVAISGPLGLCFLPAFICLGIVPVVVGLASSVLGSI